MLSQRCFQAWTGFVDVQSGGSREWRDKHATADMSSGDPELFHWLCDLILTGYVIQYSLL